MTELQIIDFAYLLKEYYPLSKQIEDKTVRDYLDWVVDLIIPDTANGISNVGYNNRFLGALQMANGLLLIPAKVYLPLYVWLQKLASFIREHEL